jgi:four helix bundle protein
MRNFKRLDIWNKGIHIVKEIYEVSKFLPKEEKFGLKSQMKRAAVSIPSNIAEGASRNSNLEFKRFLEISIGSLFEVETQLIIARELSFLKKNQTNKLLVLIEEESKMINALISKIKHS